MSYEKQEWIDHIEDAETGEIFQEGTLFTAKRMNHIEDGISQSSSDIKMIEANNHDFVLYLFFRNLYFSGVDLYISQDCDTLKRINVNTIMEAKDPSIIFKNGYWYVAATSYNPHDFIIYKSSDLVNWVRHDISLGMYNDINNKIWAPEWFEDDNGDVYILISKKIGETTDVDNEIIPEFRSYIIKCTDIDKLIFDTPIELDLESKNKIDPCIIKDNGIYNLFIKDEYDKYIEHWISPDLKNWTYKSDITELKNYVEGATIIKYKDTFYLYADSYKGDVGIIYCVSSTDLNTWSDRRVIKTGTNRVRHGAAYVITDNKAKLDVQKFIFSNMAIPEHNTRSKGYTLNQFANENGVIENLEIVDNCIYSITNNEHYTINSVTNPSGANCFYLYLSTNENGSVTFNTNHEVIGLPNGYLYSASAGDNDLLIKFIYSDSIGKFKPITNSNAFSIEKNKLKKGGWKTITLTSQTIESLNVEDGVVYRVNGNDEVIINGIVNDKKSGTHFYLLLATNGTGSITVNSGNDLTVPNGTYVMTKENGLNDCLIEFIKVDGSTFRLRK